MNQQGKRQRGRNYKNAYTVKFKQMVTMGKGYMIVPCTTVSTIKFEITAKLFLMRGKYLDGVGGRISTIQLLIMISQSQSLLK